MKRTINFDPNVVQGHQEFPPETIEFPLSKNQTKWPIELCTLKQEMETIMKPWEKAYHWSRIYFSLTRLTYLLLINRKIWLKSYGKLCNLICFFDNGLWKELLVSLQYKEMKSLLACQRAKDHKQSVCVCEHTWLLFFETSSNIKDSCLSAGVSSLFKCKLKTCWVHPCKYWVGTQ